MTYQSVTLRDLPADIYSFVKRLGLKSRKVILHETPAGTPIKLYSYWDEGSRSQWSAFDRNGNKIDIPVGGAPGFTREPNAWTPQEGDTLIEYGTFCGKPARPVITLYG